MSNLRRIRHATELQPRRQRLEFMDLVVFIFLSVSFLAVVVLQHTAVDMSRRM